MFDRKAAIIAILKLRKDIEYGNKDVLEVDTTVSIALAPSIAHELTGSSKTN
jgi:mannitol/fructose-specific phosphotransferase system IIA component (Ntr-type)